MEDYNNARIFESIARHLSLSGAAIELGVSVSTVARKLDSLELGLGVLLVHRDTRRSTLTPAGEEFAHYCQAITLKVNQAQDSIARFHRTVQGRVRVSAPSSMVRDLIAPHCGQFLLRYPGLSLTLTTLDHSTALDDSDFDISVRAHMPAENRAVVKSLGKSTFGFFARPEFLARHAAITEFAQLQALPTALMIYAERLPIQHTITPTNLVNAQASDNLAITLKPMLCSGDSQSILNAALSGHFISSVAHWAAKPHVESGALVHVLPQASYEIPIYAVLPSVLGMPERVRLVLDFLRKCLFTRINFQFDHVQLAPQLQCSNTGFCANAA